MELYVSVTDAEGGVPSDLGVEDLEVLEDGRPVQVIAVEPWERRVAGTAPERRREVSHPAAPPRLPGWCAARCRGGW